MCCNSLFHSHQRFFMVIKSGNCDSHSKFYQDFFWNQALVDFEVCLGSLPCWNSRWCPRFSFLTRIYWYFTESILALHMFLPTHQHVSLWADCSFHCMLHSSSSRLVISPKRSSSIAAQNRIFKLLWLFCMVLKILESTSVESVMVLVLQFIHGGLQCLLWTLLCKLKTATTNLAAGLL